HIEYGLPAIELREEHVGVLVFLRANFADRFIKSLGDAADGKTLPPAGFADLLQSLALRRSCCRRRAVTEFGMNNTMSVEMFLFHGGPPVSLSVRREKRVWGNSRWPCRESPKTYTGDFAYPATFTAADAANH